MATIFIVFLLDYNLTEPDDNLPEPDYNLPEPDYNLPELDYNLTEPEFSSGSLLILPEGVVVGFQLFAWAPK